MKFELFLFGVTGFLIYNTYYDGKYTNLIKMNIKYVKIIMYAFAGWTIYIMFKKNPNNTKNFLYHANNYIKYLPIDKNTSDVLTPIFDFTSNPIFTNNTNTNSYAYTDVNDKRILQSGKHTNTIKRSVSETKKKYVAAKQHWRCNVCNQQLDHTFEVDHILDLQFGGDNTVDNLVALCRNCHGKKTMETKL